MNNKYTSPYTKKQFEEYTERLARELLDRGLDAETIGYNSDMKTFISNYVNMHIVDLKPKDLLLGFTYKMSVMNLGIKNGVETENLSFPIINKYKKHDLIESIYFSQNKDKSITVNVVPVIQSPIFIIS